VLDPICGEAAIDIHQGSRAAFVFEDRPHGRHHA
jgi:hypothetical protein